MRKPKDVNLICHYVQPLAHANSSIHITTDRRAVIMWAHMRAKIHRYHDGADRDRRKNAKEQVRWCEEKRFPRRPTTASSSPTENMDFPLENIAYRSMVSVECTLYSEQEWDTKVKGIHHVCEKWIVVVVAADVRANVSECVLACVCGKTNTYMWQNGWL